MRNRSEKQERKRARPKSESALTFSLRFEESSCMFVDPCATTLTSLQASPPSNSAQPAQSFRVNGRKRCLRRSSSVGLMSAQYLQVSKIAMRDERESRESWS